MLDPTQENQGFARPFKHTQSQYVLRTWLAVCQLRVPQVSLLVSGPSPQINLHEDVTCQFDPSRRARVQQGWDVTMINAVAFALHVYRNNITRRLVLGHTDYH